MNDNHVSYSFPTEILTNMNNFKIAMDESYRHGKTNHYFSEHTCIDCCIIGVPPGAFASLKDLKKMSHNNTMKEEKNKREKKSYIKIHTSCSSGNTALHAL